MKLLIDENLPPVLARALQVLFGDLHTITCIADRFGRGIKDLEWIEALAKEGGWSVLSADKRIARNPTEKRAFLAANLVGFILGPALQKSPLTTQAARVLQLWPIMVQQQTISSRGLFELPIRSNRLSQITL